MELAQVVKEYERSLVSRNMSPRTSDSYRWALDDFLAYVERHGVLEASALASEHIEGWQESLALRLAPRSRSLASTALRKCLEWATRHDKPVTPNLFLRVETVHVPELMPRPIPLDDVTKVLKHFSSIKKVDTKDLRDRALFLCLLSTGARVGEVLQLNRRDLNRTSIVRQKGARPLTMTLLPPVRDAIDRYLAARTDDDLALWITLNGTKPRRLSPPGVREMFLQVAKRAEVPSFTTHQLRHTAATLLFAAKVPGELIADFLGHESLDSIRGYVDMTSRRQEAGVVMERLLIEAEGQTDRARPDLETLAARLESVISALASGSLESSDTESENITQRLGAAAADLRRLRPTDGGTTQPTPLKNELKARLPASR